MRVYVSAINDCAYLGYVHVSQLRGTYVERIYARMCVCIAYTYVCTYSSMYIYITSVRQHARTHVRIHIHASTLSMYVVNHVCAT
jgi:hypothetical protein